MDTNKDEYFVLLNAFTDDGWFYIVRKGAILVTDESEIKIGAKVQFPYPEDDDNPNIKKGKIVLLSSKYIYLINFTFIFHKDW